MSNEKLLKFHPPERILDGKTMESDMGNLIGYGYGSGSGCANPNDQQRLDHLSQMASYFFYKWSLTGYHKVNQSLKNIGSKLHNFTEVSMVFYSPITDEIYLLEALNMSKDEDTWTRWNVLNHIHQSITSLELVHLGFLSGDY